MENGKLEERKYTTIECPEDPQLFGTVSNGDVLNFMMGWSQKSIEELCIALQVEKATIIRASYGKMVELCRKAEAWRRLHNSDDGFSKLLFKHLCVCIDALKADYDGHDTPPWLERADGVRKIVAESLS